MFQKPAGAKLQNVSGNSRGQRTMTNIRQNILTLTFLSILFVKAIGQTPKKSDFHYELADTNANGQNKYVKVVNITDGEHTFYSKDKKVITKGTFKNSRLINGEQHFLYDRIVCYRNGKYYDYVHVVELSDSSKVKK
jgi:hypothetical protein